MAGCGACLSSRLPCWVSNYGAKRKRSLPPTQNSPFMGKHRLQKSCSASGKKGSTVFIRVGLAPATV